MRLNTVEDVYKELSRRLGREPDKEIWKLLVEDQYPEDVLMADAPLEEMLERYRRLAVLRNGRKQQPMQRSIPADYRTDALSEILALHASKRWDVVKFREQHLNSGLLTWDEAVSWIEAQHKQAGRPTRYAVVPIPEEVEYERRDPFGWLQQASLKPWSERNTWPTQRETKTLDYVRPGDSWVHRVTTKLHTPLDSLRLLSERLSRVYHWLPAAASIFVLTGITYKVPRARVTIRKNAEFPALNTITLEALSNVSVQQISAIYAKFRRDLLGPGRRDPAVTQEWRAQLAVFVAENNDGRSWREAMEVWNKNHPERRNLPGYYDNPSTFARDGRQAYEKITGNKLVWGEGGG